MGVIRSRSCPHCHESIKVEVPDEGIKAFQEGAFIQDAFPELDAATRERFITGYCGPCWDRLFPDDGPENYVGQEVPEVPANI
jgi:hypothetical protein